MNRQEMGAWLRKIKNNFLTYLGRECRSKYLRAAYLVGLRSEEIGHLERCTSSDFELIHLNAAWECLCKHYMAECYDPQLLLFEDFNAKTTGAWVSFFENELLPKVLDDDDLVRNILCAVGGLPCESPQNAGLLVYSYIKEMTFSNSQSIMDIKEE